MRNREEIYKNYWEKRIRLIQEISDFLNINIEEVKNELRSLKD